MDTTTHAAAACAIYDALPRAAQDFLRLSDVELRHWARVPDEQDHDALMQTGCEAGVECHAHSYKLAPDGVTHLTGSAPTVIATAPRECVSACREGQFDVAREIFVKAFSHYALDLCTPWHVTRELASAQHRAGEHALSQLPLPDPVRPLQLAEPKSLHRSAIQAAQETHRLFVGRLKGDGEHPAEDPAGPIGGEILAHAFGFGLAVAHYVWRSIERA